MHLMHYQAHKWIFLAHVESVVLMHKWGGVFVFAGA